MSDEPLDEPQVEDFARIARLSGLQVDNDQLEVVAELWQDLRVLFRPLWDYVDDPAGPPAGGFSPIEGED